MAKQQEQEADFRRKKKNNNKDACSKYLKGVYKVQWVMFGITVHLDPPERVLVSAHTYEGVFLCI